MQVSQEDEAQYQQFVRELAESIGTFLIDPETTLWHYTTGSALLGILQTNTLYSTQVSCLNDSTEVRYASKLFRDSLSHQQTKYLQDNPEKLFIDQALSFFEEDSEAPNHVQQPYVVTCFSASKDDLSQWRAYGGGENGYAIGFKAKDLRGIPNGILARVIYYDIGLHSRLAEAVAAKTVAFFIQGLKKYGDENITNWTANFLATWDRVITQIAPMIKDPGFDSEREYRLIKNYQLDDLEHIRFIQKSAMLSRHLPLRPAPTANDPYKLPISEIIVGPCRYPHVSRASVETLLRQCGYMFPVTLSRSPFQAT
jgi:Protein of unknown function (DUF2971)